MAGHANADMTQHYTLADFHAQEQSVLALQKRVRGASKPKQAKLLEAPKTTRIRKARSIKELSGGPDRTRICDLYRVKVAL